MHRDRNRTRATRALSILALTGLLAACGGAKATVVNISASDAYRLADRTIERAYLKSDAPGVADLHSAFEKEKEGTSLPEHWVLADLAENMLEVRLMVPDTGDSGAATHGLSEGVLASEETTTTTAPEVKSGESHSSTSDAQNNSDSHSTETKSETTTGDSHSTGTTDAGKDTTSPAETTEPTAMKIGLAACIHRESAEEHWKSSSEPCEGDHSDGSHGDSHSTTGTTPAAHASAHWSYDGETGPNRWGELDPAYIACVDGSAQTPVNIDETVKRELPDPKISYVPGSAEVVNNGHTIQANVKGENTLVLDGTSYPFLQIHFHAQSEHQIKGKHWPAEVHFVHKRDDNKIAVIGVMIEEGEKENEAWKPYVDSLGVLEGATAKVSIDWAAMLPAGKASYRYAGSLTTPPCTEGVSWVLMQESVKLSKAQIAAFQKAYSHNNRPVQDLNGRTVSADPQD